MRLRNCSNARSRCCGLWSFQYSHPDASSASSIVHFSTVVRSSLGISLSAMS